MAKKMTDVELRMEQDRCMEALDEAIRMVEAQLDELGKAGSEALDTGDETLIDQVCEAICFITEQLRGLKSQKVTTKLHVIQAQITDTTVGVLEMLDKTAVGGKGLDTKRLRKIQQHLAVHSADTRKTNKEIAGILRTTSPGRASMSDDQRSQAMQFIQAHHVAKTGGLAGTGDVWSRIAEEKKGTPGTGQS